MRIANAISRIAATLIVLAVIGSAFAGYGFVLLNNNHFTETYTSVVTETHTVVSTETDTIVTTNIPCAITFPNGTDGGLIRIPSINSTAHICAKYYYYNLNNTITVNTSLLKVMYYNNSTGSHIDQNFTISTSPSSITIGGPNNENEGAVVVYNITPKSGGNGTFEGSMASMFWMNSGHSEMELCDYRFRIVVGNGVPNFLFFFNSCLTLTTVNIYSPPQLWVEVVGLSNGTSNA